MSPQAPSWRDALEQQLQERRAQSLYRQRRVIAGPQDITLQLNGKTLLSFCSNDYLGLANHPKVKTAMQAAINDYGVGSGASHLISGHSHAHHALEEELAEFTRRPRALLFSTGYMANLGVLSALLGKQDAVYQDRLNHASLLDAGLATGARFQRYAHGDTANLTQLMDKENRTYHRRLVATDGVFSMDGDIAPLRQLSDICKKRDAILMVDDAHGFGVLGDKGYGCAELFALDEQTLPVLMCTLGKALGTFGAFVAGEERLIETLIQQARTYIYTTAMPAAVAQASRVALQLLQEESWRREKLQSLIALFKQGAEQLGLPLLPGNTPIQALILGSAEKALAASTRLEHTGILVSAIRPPTVPKNSARLRITFSANHSEQHVQQLLDALSCLPQGAQP